MNCQICGSALQIVNNTFFCPSCKIFVGKQPISQTNHTEKDDVGKIFRDREKKSFRKRIIFLLILGSVIGGLVYLFVMNFTSFGYREVIFDKYSFTPKARSYLRSKTQIQIVFLETKKPVGLTHSGLWTPGSKTVKLNSANDEVAIHEFAHAWWEEKRKDFTVRKGLIEDTIQLSKLEDSVYAPSIKRANEIIAKYCPCSGGVPGDLFGVDDHHFYAPMAEFTMGSFKEGVHKLPEFMWPYFDDLFIGKTKTQPCYVTKSCSFTWNN